MFFVNYSDLIYYVLLFINISLLSFCSSTSLQRHTYTTI